MHTNDSSHGDSNASSKHGFALSLAALFAAPAAQAANRKPTVTTFIVQSPSPSPVPIVIAATDAPKGVSSYKSVATAAGCTS